jgi:hypothetical protein
LAFRIVAAVLSIIDTRQDLSNVQILTEHFYVTFMSTEQPCAWEWHEIPKLNIDFRSALRTIYKCITGFFIVKRDWQVL